MATEILAEMKKVFEEKFGKAETRAFFSPGRVNLIGEHTDYNGGHVFPCAISLGTYALVADRQDGKSRIYSMNQEAKGILEFEMTGLVYDEDLSKPIEVKSLVAMLIRYLPDEKVNITETQN